MEYSKVLIWSSCFDCVIRDIWVKIIRADSMPKCVSFPPTLDLKYTYFKKGKDKKICCPSFVHDNPDMWRKLSFTCQ